MQTDMHYYATYAMARAAGFPTDSAQTIATAAEYVDDSDSLDVMTTDGFRIRAEPTAHHPTQFKQNVDPADQKRTWVPFHFIPGNEGSTLDEKLLCRTDSEIARAMVANTLNSLDKTFRFQLLGILAHSYVDTFSHYGFSGISSPLNKIDVGSIKTTCSAATTNSLRSRFEGFFTKYAVGPLANFLVQLGHGSVATYPDQPFLTWEFMYVSPSRSSGVRDNQKTFLAGCRKLHEAFTEARKRLGAGYDDMKAFREFGAMEQAVRGVLATEGDATVRTAAWQKAATEGRIYGDKNPIPKYEPGLFTRDLTRLSTHDRKFAERTLVYGFLEAADFHRDYLLNKLLPKHGIHIESAPVQWRG